MIGRNSLTDKHQYRNPPIPFGYIRNDYFQVPKHLQVTHTFTPVFSVDEYSHTRNLSYPSPESGIDAQGAHAARAVAVG